MKMRLRRCKYYTKEMTSKDWVTYRRVTKKFRERTPGGRFFSFSAYRKWMRL